MKNDFEHIDSDDLDNALLLIEKSFAIKFYSEELQNITTINDLCELIISKVSTDSNSCTSQKAFHKIRQAVINATDTSVKVMPSTRLSDILPKQTRKEDIKNIESNLGIKLYILRPKKWIQNLIVIFFLCPLILLFVKLFYGIAEIIISAIIAITASWNGKELEYKDFR